MFTKLLSGTNLSNSTYRVVASYARCRGAFGVALRPFHSDQSDNKHLYSVQSKNKQLHSDTSNNCPFHGEGNKTRQFRSTACKQTEVQPSNKQQIKETKDFSEMPTINKPLMIIGAIMQMMPGNLNTRIDKAWEDLFNKYGPIIRLTPPSRPIMVFSLNPDDTEVFFKRTMHQPRRPIMQSVEQVQRNSTNDFFHKHMGLMSNDDEWWRLRSRLQRPLMRPKQVAAYLPKVDSVANKLLARIEVLQEKHGRVPDNFDDDLYKWALESSALVLLDRELGCLDPGVDEKAPQIQLIRHILDMFDALVVTEMGPPIWKLYRSAAYVKLETAMRESNKIFEKFIKEAFAKVEAERALGGPDRDATIMETILATEGLSRTDVASVLKDMIPASILTTAHVIGFVLYLLATNPECQTKLQQEVDRVLGDATELLPDHIAEMAYLNRVLKESLRLYPITLGNSRILDEETVMSGYRVPAGTMVLGAHIVTGRQEKYFKRANDFVPERWDRDRPLGPIHPFASQPFGFGKRVCIGRRVAEQEMYVLLIRLMQRYTVEFTGPDPMIMNTKIIVKPSVPLAFKFLKRK